MIAKAWRAKRAVKWKVPERDIKKKNKKWHLSVDSKSLGQGSFGSVVMGKLKRTVVESLKVAVKEQSKEDHGYEVSILQSLDNRYIAPLLGSYEVGEKGFIVVPMYVSDLRKWEGPCYNILVDVLSGLDYLKTKGVVHCDIKFENICVTERGEGRIIDFGLAKYEGNPNRGFTPFYRDRYVERYGTRRSLLDHKYDVFCLCLVAFSVESDDRKKCYDLHSDLLISINEMIEIENEPQSLRL